MFDDWRYVHSFRRDRQTDRQKWFINIDLYILPDADAR